MRLIVNVFSQTLLPGSLLNCCCWYRVVTHFCGVCMICFEERWPICICQTLATTFVLPHATRMTAWARSRKSCEIRTWTQHKSYHWLHTQMCTKSKYYLHYPTSSVPSVFICFANVYNFLHTFLVCQEPVPYGFFPYVLLSWCTWKKLWQVFIHTLTPISTPL